MDKLYSCTQQGRTLLLTIVMLLLTPLSMLTFGQSPCSSSVTRQATNGKSTNTNIYDDITLAMTNLLGEGTEAAWVMEGGATFTENPDGTARFQGTVKQFGDYPTPRRMTMDVLLGGKSYSPDASGPYNQTGVPTSGWYYYYTLSGSFTGLDALAGGKLSLNIHMHPFQVGIGANQLFNAEDQVSNGAGGWFDWTIVSQPTDNALQFTNYIPGYTISDIAILLSGTPSVPCTPNPCDSIVSIRRVLNTATNCGTSTPYAMYFAGNYYTAGSNLTFTEYSNETAVLKGTVLRNGQSFNVNVTYSGKTSTAPVNSPKFELCATATNTNNGNGWMYYPEMTGTVETEGGICNVLRRGPSFQLGMFGNLQENTLGASGWFSCTNNAEVGDFNFNIGETILCGNTNGSIGDQVYCDNNNNGLFDAGDSTVTGLTITLCDANFVTITTQAVDATGKYLFTNIPAGVYNIKFPEATLDGKPQRQLGPINVNLAQGQNYLDADKGYYLAQVDPCANDTVPPVFSNCPNSIVKDVTGMTGTCWAITWAAPTANDNCSTPVVISNYNSGYCFPAGIKTVTYTATDAKGNTTSCSFTVVINKSTSCSVTGNTISKSCVNNIPVINGSTLANHEYMWLKSTTGCPTQSTQAIAGATGQHYSLPSRVTVTTYFVRCARPIGCTTWGAINESNCITINANECAPTISCTVSGNTISKSCVNNIPVITGTALSNYEYLWMKSTTGCPTQSNQVIAGATGQNYTLPSRVTVTTYFVRCARPKGCTTWGAINESNCISVTPTDCAPVPTCSTNFSSTKSYRIVSKKSGKVLDVSGAGTTNDCPIIQWGYHGGSNQQWRFFSLGSGYFKVMARNSSKYLACHYTSNGSKVYQYDYYSGGYKDWKIECVGNTGYYRLIHRASGKVLDVTGASTADGAKMQIYAWTGSDNQLFKIEEVTSAPVYSTSSTALVMNAAAESDRVRLGWLSNTGYDNDFYTVEKMNLSTGNFEKLSLVNNTQFDDQVQTHVTYDLNPTEGDNFYRVKVTMNDGFEKLTDVKKVTFKRMVGFGAFPNPATDELNVNLSEYTGKAVDIVIYNSFGKVMAREHVDNVSNSVHQLDVNTFAAGQYLIRLSAEGKRDATQQVVIQK